MNLFDLYVSGFLLLILLLVFKFKIIVPTRGYAILILIFSILTLVVATVKTVNGDIETWLKFIFYSIPLIVFGFLGFTKANESKDK